MTVLEMRNVRLERHEGANFDLRISNFSIGESEHKAIVGPSGCGKSTTLDMAGMILKPAGFDKFAFYDSRAALDPGQLWEKGDLHALTELRRKNLGYVLQTGELFAFLTVRENIELAAQVAGKKNYGDIAAQMLKKLHIEHLANKFPSRLSIGERQRTAIARALAPQPRLLLADEPTAALDPGLARHVMGIFLETAKEAGTAVVLVTHDLQLASEFGFTSVPIKTEIREDGITSILDETNV